MTLDQIFSAGLIPGYAQYRTPVPGLWMCGAATHPGGGASGLAGRNAAYEVLSSFEFGGTYAVGVWERRSRPQDYKCRTYVVGYFASRCGAFCLWQQGTCSSFCVASALMRGKNRTQIINSVPHRSAEG